LPLQIFTKAYKKKVWDIKAIVEPGGMPSSHSALCSVSGPVEHMCAVGYYFFYNSLMFDLRVTLAAGHHNGGGTDTCECAVSLP
jgi:acid phosphatase family membrane protein YuiD